MKLFSKRKWVNISWMKIPIFSLSLLLLALWIPIIWKLFWNKIGEPEEPGWVGTKCLIKIHQNF